MFIEAYHTVSVAFAKHPTYVKETRINIKVNYCLALSLYEKLLYLLFYSHVFLTVCLVFKCILGEGRKEKGSVHMAWSELVTEWHISSSTPFSAHLTLADQYGVRITATPIRLSICHSVLFIYCEKDNEILELLHLRQQPWVHHALLPSIKNIWCEFWGGCRRTLSAFENCKIWKISNITVL